MIYFIKGHDKYIKIGFTTDIKNRLSTLQTSSPTKLTVIKLTKGTIRQEKELHKRFSNLRTNGEWFELSNDLLTYIASLKDVKLNINNKIIELPKMYLSDNLKKLVREKGIKFKSLSKNTGISLQTINNWISGQNPGNIQQVKVIADFLDINVDDLCFLNIQ